MDRGDARHDAALAASRVRHRRFLTTEYVLLELGDAFSAVGAREEFLVIFDVVSRDVAFQIVPAGPDLFRRGLEIYRKHRDKKWQLTDCLSFAVMRQHHVRDALTADSHFEQAGFT